ncbi:MAG: sugar ABC transporter permease [bacterium]|uniref:Sugar ABC transporter permease n=1 Tax=Candidatus Infernicultor aquiphilus TaxID=1805029 RepID=A0A1J5GC24_9BACT|nr:sugar ABC transporter permease [bacterium]OIP67162.1 MAG: sugar ABC transporter permease [Candidatus Atribacteria bacterium CG2_30_33_13]PIU25173.1 MAG: sugar ABC transporter permease [Candidatus Atribacteria bacterium CG08_land_8_20_14_0_20_33_29]PIW11237.1 MAG: sugar ABC transporter permease [Candidatus Atribacteria bacterium CG17_big_fil_post_rev_8_21_14_2_50_34_11]PIX34973.1 MAG: sugar ABC transporter permease [Candidatus Atribacteria bacterium CG_4_8_14_3_um_filter_34_18]PJB56416.1 MAG
MRLKRDKLMPILFIMPSVITVGVFVYGFISWTGFISFTKWNDVLPNYTLIGFENYRKLFANMRFQIDLRNTLVFTVIFVISCLLIGLLLAIFLDQKIKSEGIFRNLFLLPMAISFVVSGVIWRWLFNPGSIQLGNIGVNQLFEKLGLNFLTCGWYTDPKIGIIAVAIAAIWQFSGYTMALYLAGLRGIPIELREASAIDGADKWQIFYYIIFPLLRPITFGAIIILGHISLKIFDLVVAMTGSGPAFSCDVPALFMYDTTFRGNHFAQGASIAIILLLLISLLIIPYLISTFRKEA